MGVPHFCALLLRLTFLFSSRLCLLCAVPCFVLSTRIVVFDFVFRRVIFTSCACHLITPRCFRARGRSCRNSSTTWGRIIRIGQKVSKEELTGAPSPFSVRSFFSAGNGNASSDPLPLYISCGRLVTACTKSCAAKKAKDASSSAYLEEFVYCQQPT